MYLGKCGTSPGIALEKVPEWRTLGESAPERGGAAGVQGAHPSTAVAAARVHYSAAGKTLPHS